MQHVQCVLEGRPGRVCTPEVAGLALARKLLHEVGVGLQGCAALQHGRVVAAEREALVVAPAALVRVENIVALRLACLIRQRACQIAACRLPAGWTLLQQS